MEIVTILWSLCAAVAIMLAGACGLVWLIDRRNLASLMLCILGVASAALAYVELGMMHSVTAAEYGEWNRWYHLPLFVAFMALLHFAHYYLGTGRSWLMWAFIFARSIILVVNFSVHPSFNYSEIVSLRSVSLLGEQVSTIGVAIHSGRTWFAVASLFLLIAYLIDTATQRWLRGGVESKRKAQAVSLGMTAPLLCTLIINELVVFGVLPIPLSILLWFLATLLTMAYELGRDVILSRQARLEMAELRGQLMQAERVSVLGQLSSTLVHELTQPLAATLANVEAAQIGLRNEKPNLDELRAILADIGRDDHRAAEIIGRMRKFLTRRTIEMQPLSVEDVVQDVVSLVRSDASSKHVALLLRLQPGLPRVFGDRVHLSQVLLNLLTNSIHAVESLPLDDRRIVVEAQSDGNGKVEMAVRDSGPGIPDTMTDKVFEPFFTTKADGMGVGLALSRSIIEAHGGRLWIDHMPQQDGAIFRFTLRRA